MASVSVLNRMSPSATLPVPSPLVVIEPAPALYCFAYAVTAVDTPAVVVMSPLTCNFEVGVAVPIPILCELP